MLRFANPDILYLFLGLPALVAFYLAVFRWKRKALERFGRWEQVQRLTAGVSWGRQRLKAALLVAVVMLLILALARPQIGTRLEEVKREGIDIVVAVDVSRSMLAEDVRPNRLEKAKHELRNLIRRLRGDRIGLVIFAGQAFLQCPLTLDYGAAEMFVDILDPGLIRDQGTAIAEAIRTALKAFNQAERKHKVLILITDGEDHEGRLVEAAKEAARQGVVIFTIGVGDPQGAPVPLVNELGQKVGFKKFVRPDGTEEIVMSRLDEVTLQKIALETGGKYYRATGTEGELSKILDEISGMEKKELGSLRFTHYEDRYQYVLGVALFLLIAEQMIPEWKRRSSHRGS
ncbi:MAG: VWA domain-containing protein [candidate division KSB1 bacterium]|nr:VWA domain-containing protein [candidate division KSB1 bacterium]